MNFVECNFFEVVDSDFEFPYTIVRREESCGVTSMFPHFN